MLKDYVIVDLETTGLSPANDKIIEIGAIRVTEGCEPVIYNKLVNPGVSIPEKIVDIVGINDEMVENAPQIQEIIGEFVDFTGALPLLGHNLRFDFGFLKTAAVKYGYSFEKQGVDTLHIAKKYLTGLESRGLAYLCGYFGIEDENHHRAWNDARVTGELYRILCEKFWIAGENDRDFQASQLNFAVKKESPATQRQLEFLNDLIKKHGISPECELKSLTKSQASRMIDKIILEYGRY